jgi:hypothetical protein
MQHDNDVAFNPGIGRVHRSPQGPHAQVHVSQFASSVRAPFSCDDQSRCGPVPAPTTAARR